MTLGKIPEESNQVTQVYIEIGSRVLIEIEGGDERIESIFVGQEPNKYLIVQAPTSSDVISTFTEDNYVIVRYIIIGARHSFHSRILGCATKPYPVVFLSYPQFVESVNLRKKRRVACYIPASAKINQHEKPGVLTDINSDGCRFNFSVSADDPTEIIQEDDTITISFQLLGIEGDQKCNGKVQNIEKNNDILSVGIQFDELNPEVMRKIEIYVKSVPEYDLIKNRFV